MLPLGFLILINKNKLSENKAVEPAKMGTQDAGDTIF
jgi:hypothetical protein